VSGNDVLEVIDEEMLQLEAQIRALQEKRDWLRSLKRRAVPPTNGTHPVAVRKVAHKVAAKAAPPVKKLPPTEGPSVNDMMMGYVKEHSPGAIPRREIVDFVMARKTTTSKNARAMMFGYVTGLVMKSHLTNSGPGEVVLGPKPWNPKGREG
jgi:hypothetical protein